MALLFAAVKLTPSGGRKHGNSDNPQQPTPPLMWKQHVISMSGASGCAVNNLFYCKRDKTLRVVIKRCGQLYDVLFLGNK